MESDRYFRGILFIIEGIEWGDPKLQQLSEPLLQEVSDFIDFIVQTYQNETVDGASGEALRRDWSQWFESVDNLEITTYQSPADYQQLLLDKYRQQGLSL